MRATTMWATTWNSNRRTQRHSMQLAKILIPIYRDRLSDTEEASLRQTHRILGHYPIEVILPEAVTPPEAVASLGLPVRRVSDEWLGTRNGIAGYNRMMLSQSFYDYYSDTMYVLVCHTDAWVFRDELADWCRKGYDCVAAPWVRRPVYDKPIVKQYMNWLANRRIRQGRFCRQQLYGRVGNGGFSLRRVEAFSAACDRYGANIKRYLSNSGHQWNEDVFWATVPQEFNYPPQDEALRFAFDTHPAYCYAQTGQHLPFGCHSWSKPRMFAFWGKIIPWEAQLKQEIQTS